MIEPYRPPVFPAPLGDLVFVAALGLFVALQPVASRLRAEERRAWWASNGRDVVNAVAAVSLSSSIWLLGIALPLAIFLGCTLTLTLSVISNFLDEKMERSWRLVLLLAALIGSPFVFAPDTLALGANHLLTAVFPN